MTATAATSHNTATESQINAIDVVWVRFRGGRIVPVNAETGEFQMVVKDRSEEEDELDQDGIWCRSMSLSYAVCGDEQFFRYGMYEACRSVGNGRHYVAGMIPRWNEADVSEAEAARAWPVMDYNVGHYERLTMDQIKAMDPAELAKAMDVSEAVLTDLVGAAGSNYRFVGPAYLQAQQPLLDSSNTAA